MTLELLLVGQELLLAIGKAFTGKALKGWTWIWMESMVDDA